MRKLLYFAICGMFSSALFSQTFTGTGGTINDNSTLLSFPITVSGLPSAINPTFGVLSVCINITHNNDRDLQVYLQAPDGTTVPLTLRNGGSGNNYTNTCFSDGAALPIVGQLAPFTGTFRPQGVMAYVNNGQNPNGVWNLRCQDVRTGTTGALQNWQITFGANPPMFSSNLPIVMINTVGRTIVDEPKVTVHMGIIKNPNNARNYIIDPFTDYSDSIAIELRGSTSQGFPQKPYGFETRTDAGLDTSVSILGMPIENDWILYAPYNDKTCMRNTLTFDIGNKMGRYASRMKYCELFVNGNYQGIYVMMEKIKRDVNRVDIATLTPLDIAGDELTGGYIFKVDKTTGSSGTSGWNSQYRTSNGTTLPFLYHDPSASELQQVQKNYIKSYVDSFENALNGANFMDANLGWRNFAGANSFIDMLIVNELSKNVDGYRISTFLYKDKNSNGGKIKAGPLWDYNIAWWNANYCEGDLHTGWAYNFNDVCTAGNEVPFWWTRFRQDSTFNNQLKCRWTELRQTVLSQASLDMFIDSVANLLSESQVRHFSLYDELLGQYVWPNPTPLPTSFAGEIAALKSWIARRSAWIDANIGGNCSPSVGTDEVLDARNFKAFPNPFSLNVTLEFFLEKSNKVGIEVVDMMGRVVYSKLPWFLSDGVHFEELDLAGLPSGMYSVLIKGDGMAMVKKVVKY